MNLDERFWSSSLEDLMQGYAYDSLKEAYICIICGKLYEKGIIYNEKGINAEAEKAAKLHIESEHSSMFEFFINMDKKYSGLTELQKELLVMFYNGFTDKEIVEKQGGGSTSTIRNHRFSMKEKEKQAKIFLAIMSLLNSKSKREESFIEIHRGAKMVDERYSTTEKEKEKIITTYFENSENGKLITFPSKEKKKIVVLQHIMQSFEFGKRYTEKEINEVLEGFYSDFVTIRRYLIEYGFMDREKDCSYYWVR